MNRAKLIGVKMDLSRAGVHHGVLMGMPKKTLLLLARSMSTRRREKQFSRKRRPFAPHVFEAQKRKQEGARGIMTRVGNKRREAFRA